MNSRESPKQIGARLQRASMVLTKLSETPSAIAKLRTALRRDDGKGIRVILQSLGFPRSLPPEECITLVKTVEFLVCGSKEEEVCEWTHRTVLASRIRQAGEAIAEAGTSARLLEALKNLGLIVCTTRIVSWCELKSATAERDICPGSKPTPGPDPAPRS